MLKKLCLIILVIALALGFNLSRAKPVFYGVNDRVEVYLSNPSSTAEIKTVSLLEYKCLTNVVGESVQMLKNDFDLDKFLDRYSAKIRFTENTEHGVSYYAYSNKIKYKKVVKNTLVNIQIHISKALVKIGSPIIFGSF